jgi:ornithine cyclodeaminase
LTSITFLNSDEIEQRVGNLDVVGLMEQAFAAFSKGEAVMPMPGELLIEDPPG